MIATLQNTEQIAAWRAQHPNEQMKLTGANLIWADLTGANLYGADLTGANLYGANIGDNHIWQFGPTGSRRDYLTVMHGPHLDSVRTGCFKGTLQEFEKAVVKTHGNNRYAQEYLAIIACVTTLIALTVKR